MQERSHRYLMELAQPGISTAYLGTYRSPGKVSVLCPVDTAADCSYAITVYALKDVEGCGWAVAQSRRCSDIWCQHWRWQNGLLYFAGCPFCKTRRHYQMEGELYQASVHWAYE